MAKEMSAREFIEKLRADETDFEPYGDLTITDLVIFPSDLELENTLRLGDLRFKQVVSFGHASLRGVICNRATFESAVMCESAKFGRFNCADGKFCDFGFGRSSFEETFSFTNGNFRGTLYCGEAKLMAGVNMEDPFFSTVRAMKNPSLAWVIQQYKAAGVHYDLEHAPPHMQHETEQAE